MKKTAVLLSFILCLVLLAGCTAHNEGEEGISVISSVFPTYDLARAICEGTDTRVTMLLPPGGDSHSFDPSPKDIIDISECDLFIYTGGVSDAWADKILASLDSPPEILGMMKVLGIEHKESGEESREDHSHEEHAHEYDEHVWTSPVNSMQITEAICTSLSAIDPDNSSVYRENTDKLIAKLTELHEGFLEVSKEKDIVMIFGDRFPFTHFAEEYGIEYYAAFPGCNDDTDADPATVASLIDKAKEIKAKKIFYIESSNHKIADIIAEESGSEICLFHSCHSVTAEEMRNGVTYISLMEYDLKVLKESF